VGQEARSGEPGGSDFSAFEGLPSDQWLTGRVVKTVQEGAYVEVTTPDGKASAVGYVARSHLNTVHVSKVEDEVVVGDAVEVRIWRIYPWQMMLTMQEEARKTLAEPWEQAPQSALTSLPPGFWLRGKVASLMAPGGGALVAVWAPDGGLLTGLLARTEIREDGGEVASAEDELEVSQEVRVRVLRMEGDTLHVSMKSGKSEEVGMDDDDDE